MRCHFVMLLTAAAACQPERSAPGRSGLLPPPPPWSSLAVSGETVEQDFGTAEYGSVIRFPAQPSCSESVEIRAHVLDGDDWALVEMRFDADTMSVDLPLPAQILAPLSVEEGEVGRMVFGGTAVLSGPDETGELVVEIAEAVVCDETVAFGDSPDVEGLCGEPETVVIQATGVGPVEEADTASPVSGWEDANGAPLCGRFASPD